MAIMVFQPTADLQTLASAQPPRRYSRSQYQGLQRAPRGMVPRGKGTSGVGNAVMGAPSPLCLSVPWSDEPCASSMATCGRESIGGGGEVGTSG